MMVWTVITTAQHNQSLEEGFLIIAILQLGETVLPTDMKEYMYMREVSPFSTDSFDPNREPLSDSDDDEHFSDHYALANDNVTIHQEDMTVMKEEAVVVMSVLKNQLLADSESGDSDSDEGSNIQFQSEPKLCASSSNRYIDLIGLDTTHDQNQKVTSTDDSDIATVIVEIPSLSTPTRLETPPDQN
jgi:hypothetical protein